MCGREFVGAYDIGYFPAAGTTATSSTVTGLPTDGRTLYVRLYSAIGGNWYYHDYTYVAAAATAGASMISPANGSSLSGATQTFQWTSAPGRRFTSCGSGIPRLPRRRLLPGRWNDRHVARGERPAHRWQDPLHAPLFRDRRRVVLPRLHVCRSGRGRRLDDQPRERQLAVGATRTFQWNSAPGATLYQLWVGNSPGTYDVGYFPASGTTATSLTVNGLPTDGRTLYVRLYSLIGGVYYSRDYTYTSGP
jgi:hypothetical protein